MGSSVDEIEHDNVHDVESGYVSGSSSNADLPEIYFTKQHLAFLNRQLQTLEPQGNINCLDRFKLNADSINPRNSTVVHHHSTLTLPRNRIWPHRSDHPRHAFEDEDSQTTNG